MTQNGIDDLFGGSASLLEQTAMQRILNAGLVLYERLPMLDVVLDRLTRFGSPSLRNLLGVNVELFIEGVYTVRFGSYLDSVPLPAVFGVFRAHEWDNQGWPSVGGACRAPDSRLPSERRSRLADARTDAGDQDGVTTYLYLMFPEHGPARLSHWLVIGKLESAASQQLYPCSLPGPGA